MSYRMISTTCSKSGLALYATSDVECVMGDRYAARLRSDDGQWTEADTLEDVKEALAQQTRRMLPYLRGASFALGLHIADLRYPDGTEGQFMVHIRRARMGYIAQADNGAVPILDSPDGVELYQWRDDQGRRHLFLWGSVDPVECATVNGVPRIHVLDGGEYRPDLFRWAQQRQSVRDELERRGITVLSGLTELNDKTMRSIAWDDMQRYINGEVE